jgi:hypothetical protein
MRSRWIIPFFSVFLVASSEADTRKPPTLIGAEVVVPSCQAPGPACEGSPVSRIAPSLALGIVAFNSPYLFGSLALRDGVTCRSCHAECGTSGPARRLVFDAPIPRLSGRRWGGPEGRRGDDPHLEAFSRRAIVEEFDGPEPARDIVEGLAAYVRQLPSSPSPDVVRMGAPDVALVALTLVPDTIRHNDRTRLDFLLESARFVLGEEVEDALSASRMPDGALIAANVELKAIGALASAGRVEEGERAVRDLARTLQRISDGRQTGGICPSH